MARTSAARQPPAMDAHILHRDVVELVVALAPANAQRERRTNGAFQPVFVAVRIHFDAIHEQLHPARAPGAVAGDKQVLPFAALHRFAGRASFHFAVGGAVNHLHGELVVAQDEAPSRDTCPLRRPFARAPILRP